MSSCPDLPTKVEPLAESGEKIFLLDSKELIVSDNLQVSFPRIVVIWEDRSVRILETSSFSN
jgi:hypothetical protein